MKLTAHDNNQEKLAENMTQLEQVAKTYADIENTPVRDEVYTIAKSYADKQKT